MKAGTEWINAVPLPDDPRWDERVLPFDEEAETARARATAVEQGYPEVSDTPWR